MDLVDAMLPLCLLGARAKDVLLKSDEIIRVVVAVAGGFNFILRLPTSSFLVVEVLVAMLLRADCETRLLPVQSIIHLRTTRYR
mmetsp:Transcript_43634/g.105239  ORF Transcript_43634/g.105239 Transcript_43634/m.105239 type:complete len:84 (-) Transcript_43634:19-270(-)